MKRMALFLAGFVFLLSACEKAIIGNDQIIHLEKNLTSFTDVLSSGDFDIRVKPSSRFFITMEGESNILSEIEAIIRGGNQLYIQYRSGANIGRHKRVSIIVEAPVFNHLKINGSGNFTSLDTLRSENFSTLISGSGKVDVIVNSENVSAEVFGSGDIFLRGLTRIAGLRINGSGNIRAAELHSKNAVAKVSGSGNIEVRAIEFLRAEINGSGLIMYKGDPQIETYVSGSGTVRKIQ